MSDSDEARIARLETAREGFTEQMRLLTPLPVQYGVFEERLSHLREDLNEGFHALRDDLKTARSEQAKENEELRAEIKEMKADQTSKTKERRGYLAATVVCALGLFGNFVVQLVAPHPVLSPPAKEQTK